MFSHLNYNRVMQWKELANEYYVSCEKDGKVFRGVNDDEVVVETLAGVNVVVYSCEQDERGKLIGMLSRRSLNRFSDSICLRYGKHICYIRSPSGRFKITMPELRHPF